MKNKDKLNIISKITGILFPLIWSLNVIISLLLPRMNDECEYFQNALYPCKVDPIYWKINIIINIVKIIWKITTIINIIVIAYSIIMIIKNIIKEKNKHKRNKENKKYTRYLLNILIPTIITIGIMFIISIIIGV